jgi:hypothetical protein
VQWNKDLNITQGHLTVLLVWVFVMVIGSNIFSCNVSRHHTKNMFHQNFCEGEVFTIEKNAANILP